MKREASSNSTHEDALGKKISIHTASDCFFQAVLDSENAPHEPPTTESQLSNKAVD